MQKQSLSKLLHPGYTTRPCCLEDCQLEAKYPSLDFLVV